MRVLFLIAARGGSKGVPRKNIKQLGNMPLIAYTIIAARKCSVDKRVIVSTEDVEIAEVSKRYGAEIPFMRPSELASDTASSVDVVKHAAEWINRNDKYSYDYICLLQPSAPFITYQDLNESLRMIDDKGADTLLGVKEVKTNKVFIHSLDEQGKLSHFYQSIQKLQNVRRQEQPVQYTMNGAVYIARWDYFMKNATFHSINSLPYVMPEERSVDIDTIFDYNMAAYMIEKKIISIGPWEE